MKLKFITIIIILALSIVQAASLNKIRSNAEPKNHRIVFDIDALKGFKTDKKNDQVTITVFDCDLNSSASGVTVNSKFIQNFKVEQSGSATKISFKLPAEYKVKTFKIDQPDRIVLDVSSSGYIQPPAMADPATLPATKPEKNNKAELKTQAADKNNLKNKPNAKTENNLPEKNVQPDIVSIEDLAAAFKQQEYDKVINLSSVLIKERPATLQALLHRSLAYLEKGKLEKNKAQKNKLFKAAVTDLNKVVIDSIAYIEGHAKMAEIYRLLGDENKADEHYAIFMGNFQQPESDEQNPKDSLTNGHQLIPAKKELSSDSLSGHSFFGQNIVSNLFIYILGFFVLVLIILLWIRKKMNSRIQEEIEDSPVEDNLTAKDDLFEKLRPSKLSTKSKSSQLFESKIEESAFLKNESAVNEYKPNPDKLNVGTTEQDVLDKMLNEHSSEDDYVSISLDDSTRDRIIELYDDGYTNREIAEQLKISYDEVNFIIRSLGEADNEAKNKNKDVLNSKAGGISDSQNEETLQMKEIQDLYRQGVSIDELMTYFKKPKDEIEFIISLIPHKQEPEKSSPAQSQQSNFFQNDDQALEDETDQLPYKIKELAEMGLSRRLIAEELKIGIDEVDFAAAMFKIGFTDSVVDIPSVNVDKSDLTSDELLANPMKTDLFSTVESEISDQDLKNVPDEEIDEALMLSEAMNHEKTLAEEEVHLPPIQESLHLEQNPEDVIEQILQEENLADEEQSIEDENFNSALEIPDDSTKETVQEDSFEEETQMTTSKTPVAVNSTSASNKPRIVTKDDIGIDLDNFLTSRSINQDFGIAESRVFNFDKDEFKDNFASLPADDNDFSGNDLTKMRQELQQQEIKKAVPHNSEEDYFLQKSALRKQLAAEMKLDMLKNNEDVEKKFGEIDEVLNNKLKSASTPVVKYHEPELSKSFEDIINDYEPAQLTENQTTENSDDDLLLMREVYSLLDQGEEIEAIATKLSISIDDVLIYQKIKSGNL